LAWDDTKQADDLIKSSEWNTMVTDQKGRVIGTNVTEAIADTSANLPSAGSSGRLMFETDTGRVLYDNGTSLVEVGLSESQISLANLGSKEADNLAGNNGTSGQFLQTDGSSLSFADVSAGGKFEQALSNGEVLADDGTLYSSIQTAENNASDYVFVGPGTFNESVTIDTEGLMVMGAGDNTYIYNNTGSGKAISVQASNVTLKEFSIESDTSNAIQLDFNGVENIVKNVRVINSGFDAFKILADRTIVQNCIVENSGNKFMDASVEVKVVNNIFKNASAQGISFSGANTVIKNNKFDTTTNSCIISSSTATGSIISSNNFVDTGNTAINTNSDETRIQDNYILNSSSTGIAAAGNDDVIGGNIIKGSTDDAIFLQGTDQIVYNNRVASGINTVGATSPTTDANVSEAFN